VRANSIGNSAKGRTVLTRTHYWYQHEPIWYVRKKNAPWFGRAGDNSTVWACRSPKFFMGGSKEQKCDHPTQKPADWSPFKSPLLISAMLLAMAATLRFGRYTAKCQTQFPVNQ
jgi:hypothetical protein